MSKIKPCPFCNRRGYRIGYLDDERRFMVVWCVSCGASGPFVMADPFYINHPNKSRGEVHQEMRKKAIELWNERKEE